jgi:hypothetical protein
MNAGIPSAASAFPVDGLASVQGLTASSTVVQVDWMSLALASAAHLARMVANHRAALLTLAPTSPVAHPYSRTVIANDHRGEVLLMTWRSDAISAIHDHGAASGCVFALRGNFSEDSVILSPSGAATVNQTRIAQGEQFSVDRSAYHVMRAPLGGVTLHIYTPRPQGMRIADPAARCIWHVAEGHGAWLPVDSSMVLERLPWPA